jgi:hypothetical protein
MKRRVARPGIPVVAQRPGDIPDSIVGALLQITDGE